MSCDFANSIRDRRHSYATIEAVYIYLPAKLRIVTNRSLSMAVIDAITSLNSQSQGPPEKENRDSDTMKEKPQGGRDIGSDSEHHPTAKQDRTYRNRREKH